MSDSFDIRAQLADLSLLADGWFGGNHGRQLSKSGIERLINSWEQFCPSDLQTPFLYVTIEGNIRSEWCLGALEISLEINLNEFTGCCHVTDSAACTKKQDKEEFIFDFKNDHDWVKLFRGLRRCLLLNSL